jgi:Carbohydrate esterase 2 N-terminal/GDSL-like Lipase/Acylhydrolase family
MKRFFLHSILVSFSILLADCSFSQHSGQTSVLSAIQLSPFGRYDWNENKELELISSGVNVGFSFSGNECRIYSHLKDTTGHSYLQYELDGTYRQRVRIDGNSTQPLLISATTDGHHTVWLYKATEAHTGPIFIEKITGRGLKPVKRPTLPLIEFIGNSITCGAAADVSETPCGQGEYHDQHNAYYAYGPRVARMLNANFVLSSVSGIGIYRTWNMNGPSMPQVYEKTDFQEHSSRNWDFSTYRPRIVSIALGTNDLSNGDGKHARDPFDSAVFVHEYVRFVQLVKIKYPDAIIALLSSPMINGERRILLQNCLSAVKKQVDALYPRGKKVALYFFVPMQARGCGGHPSVEDHAILAYELLPFFKKLL